MRKLDVLDGEGQIVMHIYLDPKAGGLGRISHYLVHIAFLYIFSMF